MENSFDYITENYNRIYNEIEAAKAKYRKPSDHVDFMAVTKTVAPEAVNHAIHCGISLLGENRVQEYLLHFSNTGSLPVNFFRKMHRIHRVNQCHIFNDVFDFIGL